MGGVLKMKNESGRYYNTGIITVAENLQISTLVDRGFPDYKFLVDTEDKMIKNYFNFLHLRNVESMPNNSVREWRINSNLLHDSIRVMPGNFKVAKHLCQWLAMDGKGTRDEIPVSRF